MVDYKELLRKWCDLTYDRPDEFLTYWQSQIGTSWWTSMTGDKPSKEEFCRRMAIARLY